MAVALTQVITEDRASGSQIIDGSLRFDGSSCLTRTFSSSGDRRTWTWSGWAKRGDIPTSSVTVSLFGAYSDGNNRDVIRLSGAALDQFEFQNGVSSDYDNTYTSAKLRDTGWYHFVVSVDTDQATQGDRVKLYINGELQDLASSPQATRDTITNHNVLHFIGARSTDGNPAAQWDGYISQVYFVDGQQLAPSEFGFTDPLTNTWRPKKYTGTYGTNGFYLPMDGNSPIGEDRSGNGNDWTPVNFGGSNSIEKATGALPILNTVNGGNAAGVGVRTDTAPGNGPVGVSTHLVLAIPMAGIATDVSNKINGGSTEKIITSNGVTGVSSSRNFYESTTFFDGSNDWISIASSSDFEFGSGDFTVEFWFKSTKSSAAYQLLASRDMWTGGGGGTPWFIQLGNTDKVWISGTAEPNAGWEFSNACEVEVQRNRWNHIAFVRNGNTLNLYGNGRKSADQSFSQPFENSSNDFIIGRYNEGQYFEGYIQDFRIYKGVAKYTSNFIPASTDPDIVPDTPSGVAYGSALTKITDGAVKFDGTSDYLAVTNSNDFDFDGTFTMEAFVYADTLAANPMIFSRGGGNTGTSWSATNGAQFALYCLSDGVVRFEYNNGANGSHTLASSAGSVVVKRWHHIAVTYDTTTFTLWVDGVSAATGTGSPTMPTTRNLVYIGMWPTSADVQEWQGYISNLRFVKGTQLYTSNFTPPTSALTNVTNTTLLCCQDKTGFITGAQPILNTNSTGITTTSGTRYDPHASSIVLALAMNGSNGGTTFTDVHPTIKGSGSAKTITVQNDVQTSTAQSKYYGSSALFDGTGDRLDVGNSSDYAFGTGDYTVEMWVYHTSISDQQTYFSDEFGNHAGVYFYKDTNHKVGLYYGSQIVTGATSITTDEWHHIAVTRTGGTSRVFLDGVLDGSGADTTDLTQTIYHIADSDGGSSGEFFGYIQDVRVYKGVAKYTSNFTVTAPSVEPITAVSPGSIVAAGNATALNLDPFNTNINTVRGQETSYPTLNPLFQQANVVLSNGNLDFTVSTNSSAKVGATIGIPTSQGGKYYWEVTQTSRRRVAAGVMNVVGTGYSFANNSDLGASPHEWGVRFSNSSTQGAGTAMQKAHNDTYANHGNIGLENGDTLQIALDLDNTSIWFGGNGSWFGGGPEANSGATYTNLTGEIVPFVQRQTGTSGCKINFGQKPFKYTPPEGFKPITLTNLSRPTAVRPDKYFKTITYTGNGSTQSINGVGFAPDLVWIKERNAASTHSLQDTVRGAGDSTTIRSDAVNNEDSLGATYGYISSFDTDGFSLDAGSLPGERVNGSDDNYVAWCWKAGGDAGTFNVDGVDVGSAAAAGLSGKNITPTACSIGTKQGFSIIKYTGNGSNNQTVPHGLTQAPAFILTKSLNESGSPTVAWGVFHKDGSFNNSMVYLMQSNSAAGDTNVYTTTSQTDEHFTIGTWPGINQDTTNYISYIWHDIPGLQKFGSFEGNNSSDGTFVELGFRPSMIIIRGIDNNSRNWLIDDATRNPYNGKVNTSTFSTNYAVVAANSNSAEPQSSAGTFEGNYIDHLSNGFKLRSNAANSNGSETYIFAAWAEAPTNNLFGGQANAR